VRYSTGSLGRSAAAAVTTANVSAITPKTFIQTTYSISTGNALVGLLPERFVASGDLWSVAFV
jgi:hypothetical protein